MVDYEREEEHTTPEQPKRSKKGYFLSSLIGVIVGAVLMAFIMPYLSNEGLDTGALDQQQNNNGRESIRTVNVSVNNAVTKIVSNMSPAVVGVVNIQNQISGERAARLGAALASSIRKMTIPLMS